MLDRLILDCGRDAGVMIFEYTVGDFVVHPDCPHWGHGQVQSVIGRRVTVTFEHAGKTVIMADVVNLEPVADKTVSARNPLSRPR